MAVNAPERLAIAPDVRTLAQAGLAGADLLGWSGLYAPARTPPATLPLLDGALRAALADAEVKALFESTGTILWDRVDAAMLARALEQEIPRMRMLFAQTGARRE